MEKSVVRIANAAAPISPQGVPPLSPAIKVTGVSNLVFVSGQPPRDIKTGEIVSGDIQAQTRASLDQVKALVEAAGSSMDKVVKCTVYCSNSAYFQKINEAYKAYFPKDPPTRTFVTVGSWPGAFDIEVEAIAVI